MEHTDRHPPSSGTTAPDAPTAVLTVRYWAGARAAAGVDAETVALSEGTGTVSGLVAHLTAARPALAPVLPVCAVLVDGRAGSGDDPVPAGSTVEVLPPFAGG